MKTKQSFRKKALLSSVAMLLVAAVAVGSATFAWFTHNDKATANGIYIKTMRGSSLEVSGHDISWGPIIEYKFGSSSDAKSLFPASTTDGSTWVHAHSTSKTTATPINKDDVEIVSPISYSTPSQQQSNYVFKQQLNVRNMGSQNQYSKIRITCNNIGSVLGDYGRIALVPCQENGDEEPGDFVKHVFGAAAITNFKGLTKDIAQAENAPEYGVSEVQYNVQAQSTPNPLAEFTLNLGEDNAKYFNLYIWFEGQDTPIQMQLKLSVILY